MSEVRTPSPMEPALILAGGIFLWVLISTTALVLLGIPEFLIGVSLGIYHISRIAWGDTDGQ